ncbi:aspartic peptidase domain-containing protein [Lobosporangium transversale]|uniref:rhizopuspepsin n=1 Tax=Lobosporangium transversale TaxID=64571 RepID=A0A1Y2GH17_9FUNG|nr:aspartic peptidase domain-containing protein [Lobosporangium transversale]ORZ10678.1 aspartic peptidase domain-containing protein [Lobosporangium transversale]|eukprot:XP_021879399.1 aspartic peptidase domain-containing protein [Lobosporangium transversale]
MAQIPLIDYDFDREYYGAVQVGEPPQTFKIDFDTGSSKFILSSKACKDCSGSTRFDPAASHTFRLNNEYENELGNKNSSSTFTSDPNTWHITYGDMSHAEGILGRDHVTIANLTVRHQQIALILSESANFDDVVDGIMGLSFGTLSSPSSHPQTLFENMMDQGLVKHGVFSFYLGKNYPNGTSDPIDSGSDYTGGGEVIFGGVDTSRVREGFEIVYTPVTKPKYWQINIENIFVAGQRKQSNIVGIMDTGTTLMIVPERLAFAVHQLIPGAVQISGQSWTIPCDLTSTTRIELEIEGHRFAIPFSDLVREAVRLDGQMASGIDKGNGPNFMIIGDLFIKNNYVVFDQANQRVGIAPLKFPSLTKHSSSSKNSSYSA